MGAAVAAIALALLFTLFAPQRQIRVSGLLRESPLAIPYWPTHLPFSAWGIVIHLAWMYRILRGTDADAADRARAAATAEWLTAIVADGSTAVVVTHGVFRRLLANQLYARGWATRNRRGGYRHWSAWSFSRSVS